MTAHLRLMCWVVISPVIKSVTAKLNSKVLYGFFIIDSFFKSTEQNMRLSTKAEPAIMLNATWRTVSNWSAFTSSDWWLGPTAWVMLLLVSKVGVLSALSMFSKAVLKVSEEYYLTRHIFHFFCRDILKIDSHFLKWKVSQARPQFKLKGKRPVSKGIQHKST